LEGPLSEGEMAKKYKSLFITHDVGNYGASKSLQLLLRHYEEARVGLIVQKALRRKHDLDSLKTDFGRNVESVRDFFLPFDFCYKRRPKWSFHHFLQKCFVETLWRCSMGNLYEYIEFGGYDFIHLNSLVLHQIIDDRYAFFIHTREIYDGANPAVYDSLCRAKGIIFIDGDAFRPFAGRKLPDYIILNNPFDMTPLSGYTPEKLGRRYAGLAECTVFSLLGRIEEEKGVDFIIRCFKETGGAKARLLIVGDGERQYVKKCRDIAGSDKRIIFWGEEPDIFGIYRVSDYILRGEAFRCIGRTIYEGLYSGCSVIVPAEQSDGNHMFEYGKFRDSIYFYPPRDHAKFISLVNDLSKSKVIDRVYRTNVPEYVAAFDGFVSGVLGRK